MSNDVISKSKVSGLKRRDLLKMVPALLLSPALMAQTRPAAIGIRKLHSFGLKVSNVARSLAFYQDVFGAPVQARQGESVLLRIGAGPYYFSLSPLQAGETPHIQYIGISVPGFNLATVQAQLQAHGISPASAPISSQSALDAANHSWVRERASDGAQDLFFADRDGLVYQLNDPSHCGGSGALGNRCEQLEPSPAPGFLRSVELSHFTNRVFNSGISNQYHRELFGLNFQALQGPGAPVIGVGDGVQFLMYIGGAAEGTPTRAGAIDHVCLSVEDFNVERILGLLTDYGLKAREDAANTPPLVHYVSMRMPNRGGAEGGTPELYFSDPDGIRVQLQDAGYCGGTGYLGDDCTKAVE